MLNSVLAVF